jgi:hypothetical protein
MAEHALRCIARMDEAGLDYTMLWLVRHWDWLVRSTFGRELTSWLDMEMGLHRQEVVCCEFHNQVTRVYRERGIRRIAPERMVWATKKKDLYELAESKNWPKPFCPFMIQTRPPELTEAELKARGGFKRAGVFLMFSNWQAGFYKIAEIAGCRILKDQKGKPIHDFVGEVHQVAVLYENQITQFGTERKDCPCRIILDCDLKCADFEDKYSLEDMIRSVEVVPVFFVRRLAEISAIRKTDVVIVVEKVKDRPGKVSRHYTFNLMGMSKGEIYQVLDVIFKKPFMDKKKGLTVSASVLDEDEQRLISPFEIADTSTMHGNNQFSVMLMHDPKKKETRNPVQTMAMKISNAGKTVERMKTPWAGTPNDPEHPHALEMLARSCYSNFTQSSIIMDSRFMTLFHEGESLYYFPRA